jgi:hypothetical protein
MRKTLAAVERKVETLELNRTVEGITSIRRGNAVRGAMKDKNDLQKFFAWERNLLASLLADLTARLSNSVPSKANDAAPKRIGKKTTHVGL